jgi:hypothetical protein
MTNPFVQWAVGIFAAIIAFPVDLISQIPMDDMVNSLLIISGTAALTLGNWAFKRLSERHAKN